MRGFTLLFALVCGISLGVWATRFVTVQWASVFGLQHGIWHFQPKLGSSELDPYLRAWLFGREDLPLADGEGYSLQAELDSSGNKLQASCTYHLEGPLPQARYWTFIVVDKNSRRIPEQSKRNGFSSSEISYSQGQPVSMMLSPDSQFGHWVPLFGAEEIVVIFRFYEIPLSASATKLSAAQLPSLTKIGCAP